MLWQQRLDALAEAVQAVCGSVIVQIAAEQSGPAMMASLARNARIARRVTLTNDTGWSTGTTVTVSVLSLGALGGLGYWLFKAGKWPFKGGWPFK